MPMTTTGQVWPLGATASSAAPTPVTYGVPPGTVLTTFTAANNPLTGTQFAINSTGTRYNIKASYTFINWRFNHRVFVDSGTVNFVNCRFAGAPGDVATGSVGLMANDFVNGTGVVTCTNCTFIPQVPYDAIDGVRGGRFTLDRCEISGTVDGLQCSGGSVTVRNTWFHQFPYYDNNSHPGTPPTGTHNDAVQIAAGSTFLFEDNLFEGTCNNAGFMITQDAGPISNVNIRRNAFNFSDCTADINVYDIAGTNAAIAGLSITNNEFNRDSQYQINVTCRTQDLPGTVISGNVWIDGGLPVPSISGC